MHSAIMSVVIFRVVTDTWYTGDKSGSCWQFVICHFTKVIDYMYFEYWKVFALVSVILNYNMCPAWLIYSTVHCQ